MEPTSLVVALSRVSVLAEQLHERGHQHHSNTVASSSTASASVTPSSVGGIGPVTPIAMNTGEDLGRAVGRVAEARRLHADRAQQRIRHHGGAQAARREVLADPGRAI